MKDFMRILLNGFFMLIVMLTSTPLFSRAVDVDPMNHSEREDIQMLTQEARALIKALKTKYIDFVRADESKSMLSPILKYLAMVPASMFIGAGVGLGIAACIQSSDRSVALAILIAQLYCFAIATPCASTITYLILMKILQDPHVSTHKLKEAIAELRQIDGHISSAVRASARQHASSK